MVTLNAPSISQAAKGDFLHILRNYDSKNQNSDVTNGL